MTSTGGKERGDLAVAPAIGIKQGGKGRGREGERGGRGEGGKRSVRPGGGASDLDQTRWGFPTVSGCGAGSKPVSV